MISAAFAKSFLIVLWLLVSLTLASGQDQKSRAQKLFAEAEELFNKNTPEARAEAAPKYAEVLKLWQELGDEKQQVEPLNKLVEIYASSGDYAKSLDYSERLLPIAQKLGEKNLEGGVLFNIGRYHDALGETRKGLGYVEKSAELLREIGEKQRAGIALNSVGVMNYNLGEIQKAFEIYNRVLALRRELGDRRGEAYTLINLGYSYSDGGDKRKGVEFYEQALKIAVEIKDSRAQSLIINNLASVLHDLGEYQKAFDFYRESLALYKQNGDKAGEAMALNNLAALYRDLGDFENALKFIGEAAAIYQANGLRREEARIFSSTGAIYSAMSDKAKALELYQKALEIHRSLENKEGRAIVLRNIGKIYLDGNESQKALKNFQTALSLAEDVQDAVSTADILVLLAQTYAKLNDAPKAEANFVRALNIQGEGVQSEKAESLYHYARFEERNGRRASAMEKMLEALKIVENLRSSVIGQNFRSSYLAEQQKYFDFYIQLLVAQHRQEPKKGFDALALQVSESARARSLLESLGESQADIRGGIAPELLAKERLLRQTINAKETQRLDAAGQKNPTKAAVFEKEIGEAVEKYRELQTEIRRQSPQYAALNNSEPLALADIQAQILDENSILLEYSLGAERSFLFAVTKNTLDVFDLPTREIIEKSARQAIEKIKLADALAAKTDLTDLSRILLAPVADKLQNKRLLIVAPGVLQYVPFAALPIPDSRFQIPDSKNEAKPGIWNPKSGMKYLIETNEIVNLPSVSVLSLLRQNKTRPTSAKNLVAIVADPVFTSDDARLKLLAKQKNNQDSANGTTAVMREVKILPPQLRAGFGRLRFSRLEADAILALARNNQKFVAMDFAANLKAATGEDLQKSGIVHLATHGIINSDYPELSGVVLSLVDENGNAQDGFLRLHDVYNLRLDARLVVLSACETALGKEIKGEGIVGLTRGFMYAGSPTVVASLWKVDDRATADLMRRFYQKMLNDRLRPADALRRAQISMLSEKPTQNPFFWAAFTIQGEYK